MLSLGTFVLKVFALILTRQIFPSISSCWEANVSSLSSNSLLGSLTTMGLLLGGEAFRSCLDQGDRSDSSLRKATWSSPTPALCHTRVQEEMTTHKPGTEPLSPTSTLVSCLLASRIEK